MLFLDVLQKAACATGALSCIRNSGSIAQFNSFVFARRTAISSANGGIHAATERIFTVSPTDDIKTIEGVIQRYLDGLYESDASKIASVFHPTSALTSIGDDGELVITP